MIFLSIYLLVALYIIVGSILVSEKPDYVIIIALAILWPMAVTGSILRIPTTLKDYKWKG